MQSIFNITKLIDRLEKNKLSRYDRLIIQQFIRHFLEAKKNNENKYIVSDFFNIYS
jgi:hypothetical protein